MKRDMLNDMDYMMNGEAGLNKRSFKLIEGSVPLNEFMWTASKLDIDGGSISMLHLKYVDYIDLINQNIKPFKKL